MNKKHLFGIFLCAGMFVSCCYEYDELDIGNNTEKSDAAVFEDEHLFPVEDDAVNLSGTRAEQMYCLLGKVNPEQALTLYNTRITDEQFDEIKAFTDNLVKDLTSQFDIHETLFRWVCDNIKYEQSDNDPYPVFINRRAICQGYANLLKVMLLSQNISVVSVNGMMYNIGHAWLYVYADESWYMSDPTNGKISIANDINDYVGYEPSFAELSLFENEDYQFEYSDGLLNISRVKKAGDILTVPYSAGGFVVRSFNPKSDLPENIREVYIGKNISAIGGNGLVGLDLYGQSVENVYIDPLNPELESYKGIVYQKKGDTTTPYYIPYNMTNINLKPNREYGKGVISGHECVEEIVFPKGVESIGDYAIENCPKLKRVYIPENAVISENALYGMSQEIEIIRQKEGTGIPVVTVD